MNHLSFLLANIDNTTQCHAFFAERWHLKMFVVVPTTQVCTFQAILLFWKSGWVRQTHQITSRTAQVNFFSLSMHFVTFLSCYHLLLKQIILFWQMNSKPQNPEWGDSHREDTRPAQRRTPHKQIQSVTKECTLVSWQSWVWFLTYPCPSHPHAKSHTTCPTWILSLASGLFRSWCRECCGHLWLRFLDWPSKRIFDLTASPQKDFGGLSLELFSIHNYKRKVLKLRTKWKLFRWSFSMKR